jgi:hypothetical protein
MSHNLSKKLNDLYLSKKLNDLSKKLNAATDKTSRIVKKPEPPGRF